MVRHGIEIREGTRRDIVDMLVLRAPPFHGRLDYLAFVKRVWPLDEMPSEDRRFNTATADIATHMRFGDWDVAHLLMERLHLASGPDDEFLRFLEAVVHSLVVPDESEALTLVTALNGSLERDGFHLVETDRISGKPSYSARPVTFVRAAPEPSCGRLLNRPYGIRWIDRLLRCASSWVAPRRRKNTKRSGISAGR